MIKVETLGMLDVAKINPVLTSASEVANYSILTIGGILYLISNDVAGDDAYKEGLKFAAGEYLNGYDISAWVGQKLVVDAKHITGGVDALTAGTSVLIPDTTNVGKLKTGSPSAGDLAFKVTEKVTLTEKAVKVQVFVAGE